ncbi:Uncharacterised protein [Chlamydia trachomatis]|nr:Uncharacterised protein [Chlamydia trachomatis]
MILSVPLGSGFMVKTSSASSPRKQSVFPKRYTLSGRADIPISIEMAAPFPKTKTI